MKVHELLSSPSQTPSTSTSQRQTREHETSRQQTPQHPYRPYHPYHTIHPSLRHAPRTRPTKHHSPPHPLRQSPRCHRAAAASPCSTPSWPRPADPSDAERLLDARLPSTRSGAPPALPGRAQVPRAGARGLVPGPTTVAGKALEGLGCRCRKCQVTILDIPPPKTATPLK